MASRDSVKAWSRAAELSGVSFQCVPPHTLGWRQLAAAKAVKSQAALGRALCQSPSEGELWSRAAGSQVLDRAVEVCVCMDSCFYLKYPCYKSAWLRRETAEQRGCPLYLRCIHCRCIKMRETHLLVVTGD